MTNKEKYQRTFSTLHASEDCIREVKTMKKTSKVYMNKLVAVCAAAVMVLALASLAYAADVGGIRERVQIWLYGEQTDAMFESDGNGEYTLTYTDENGVEHHRGGGGVEIDAFGRERPLTAEELMGELTAPSPEVEYRDDGTSWLYYGEEKIELTDKYDADGFCYITLTEGDHPLYVTVKYQKGMCAQCDGFAGPEAFED